MARFWSLPSGTKLATLEERITTEIALPLIEQNANITIQSGSLPRGMRLENNAIVGTPLEVVRITDYKFVLRAEYNDVINERTYIITVEGADAPEWRTPEDLIAIGENDSFYILDSSPVDFQLEATDTDLSAGDQLEFYISDGDGILPPGIELTSDGRLVGIVDPILAIAKSQGAGEFDTGDYGTTPYDFGIRSSNGFDSFFFDTTTFDFNFGTKSPKKLNRYYEFVVSVTDGDIVAKRRFRIFVVGDDFLRADNTIMQVGTGVFTADNTNIRTPIWLTPRDLGYKRANNYVTLMLDTIDPNTLSGLTIYNLEPLNDDGTPSVLPPGMDLDTTTGEVTGLVPYQPAVTKEYKFTVRASRYGATTERQSTVFTVQQEVPVGTSVIRINSLGEDLDNLRFATFTHQNRSYKIIDVNSSDDEGGYNLLTLGENVSIQTKTLSLLNDNTLDIVPIGQKNLNLILNKNIRIGAYDYKVIGVNDGSKIYQCTTEHFSSADLNQDSSFWREINVQDIAEIPYWNSETTFRIGDIVRYSDRGFDILTLETTLGNPIGLTQGIPAINLNPGITINISSEQGITDLISADTSFATDTVVQTVEFEVAEKSKTFIVRILGEIESTIKWLSDANLGQISSNYISTLSVKAETNVPNAQLIYSLISGTLPPGLSLSFDGEIIGKINSFGSPENPGLTVFDNQNLILDGNTTSIDRKFTFSVRAQDQFGFSAIDRTFTVDVTDPDDKLYSNLYAKPFMKDNLRIAYTNLISNSDYFPPSYIYRPNDPNFGLQKELKMLVYSGIETKKAEEYVGAIAKNHKRKRYRMGEVKIAVAKDPGTQNIVYEIVYLEVIDPSEPSVGKTNKSYNILNKEKIFANTVRKESLDDNSGLNDEPFRISPRNKNTIQADSNAIKISDSGDITRYISNITNSRDNIRALGETEINFLPLWMRTPQEGNINILGYVPAVPLVYCKPGTSKIIKEYIDFIDFDFNQFDFDIDRYIIDSTEGNGNEQYLLFANYQFNV